MDDRIQQLHRELSEDVSNAELRQRLIRALYAEANYDLAHQIILDPQYVHLPEVPDITRFRNLQYEAVYYCNLAYGISFDACKTQDTSITISLTYFGLHIPFTKLLPRIQLGARLEKVCERFLGNIGHQAEDTDNLIELCWETPLPDGILIYNQLATYFADNIRAPEE